MLSRMKLMHQTMLLVAVPLVFECGFVISLFNMVSALEVSLAQETKAKKAITILTGMMQMLLELESQMVESTLLRDPSVEAKYLKTAKAINNQGHLVTKLVSDDPEARKIIQKGAKHLKKLLAMTPAIREALDPEMGDYCFVQFLHDTDFWTELLYNARQNKRCIEALIAHYERSLDSARPAEIRGRAQIKTMVAAMLVFNLLLAFALALIYSNTAAKRLSVLMSNVDRFGSGKKLLEPITGADEIAALDRAFREMADARRRAEQIRRDMVAMVSHDLRTPLSGTAGFVTLLLEGVYGPIEKKQYSVLSKMESELQRLIRLANDLLDAEKIESGQLELNIQKESVGEIVHSSINAVRGIAEIKEVHLKSEYPPNLTWSLDADRIIQVLVNLLSNAIKFSGKASDVDLRVSTDLGTIRFEVQDQGPGIPAESINMVFDRFRQLDQELEAKRTGSGLGLTISKAMVEAHGGTIGVTSELGHGSTFWLMIPEGESQTSLGKPT